MKHLIITLIFCAGMIGVYNSETIATEILKQFTDDREEYLLRMKPPVYVPRKPDPFMPDRDQLEDCYRDILDKEAIGVYDVSFYSEFDPEIGLWFFASIDKEEMHFDSQTKFRADDRNKLLKDIHNHFGIGSENL